VRTQEEVVERINDRRKMDLLGFEISELMLALDWDHVKQYLKENQENSKEEWEVQLKTDEDVVEQVKRYLPFAIEKAVDHRGISAGRSINHYRAWFWLMGDDEMFELCGDDSKFAQYGCPILKKIAEKYGVDTPKGHEGEIFDAMARGEMCPACRRGDESGCGS
jgi:hypothetical protein